MFIRAFIARIRGRLEEHAHLQMRRGFREQDSNQPGRSADELSAEISKRSAIPARMHSESPSRRLSRSRAAAGAAHQPVGVSPRSERLEHDASTPFNGVGDDSLRPKTGQL